MKAQEKESTGLALLMIIFLVWVYITFPSMEGNPAPQEGQEVPSTFLACVEERFGEREEVEGGTTYALEDEERTYIFTRQGAQLLAVTSKKYTDSEGQPYKLLTSESPMGWQLTTADGAHYHSDRLSFSLEERGKRRLAFVYRPQSALSTRITYRLNKVGTLSQHITLGSGWASRAEAHFTWYLRPVNQERHLDDAQKRTYLTFDDGEGGYNWITRPLKKEEAIAGRDLGNSRWLSLNLPYFLVSCFPGGGDESAVRVAFQASDEEGAQTIRRVAVEVTYPTEKLQEGQEVAFYFGVNDPERVQQIADSYPGLGFEKSYYYGPSYFGTMNYYVVMPVFNALYGVTGSIPLSIMFLIFLFALLFFFFYYKSQRYNLQGEVLKPYLEKIKEGENARFKEGIFLQKVGLNPLIPVLTILYYTSQLFVIIALYSFARYNVVFRQKPFLWIADLSTYDDFLLLPFTIPYVGQHVSLICIVTLLLPPLVKRFVPKETTPKASSGDNPFNTASMRYLSPFMMFYFLNNRIASIFLPRIFFILSESLQCFLSRKLIDEDALRKDMVEKAEKGWRGSEQKRSRAELRLAKREKRR